MINIDYFKQCVIDKYPFEEIGYIDSSTNAYVSLENIQSDPLNNFQLSEKDSLFLAMNPSYDIIHSHTTETFTEDPRIPSYNDMICKKNLQNRMGIVHCDGENVTDILYFGEINKEPLLGRGYLSNIFDCFTLARDYFYNKFSVDLGLHPRPPEWEEWDKYYIQNTYMDVGFVSIPVNKLNINDVILFSIGSTVPNHIGIVTGKNTFIHHLRNRKSSEDSIQKWSKQIHSVLRYTGK